MKGMSNLVPGNFGIFIALTASLLTFLSFTALLFLSGSAYSGEAIRANKQVMTLASQEKNGLKVVDVICDGAPSPTHCILSGTHIYRATRMPLGALGDSGKTCYMETGQAELNVKTEGDNLISEDGPGGACETTVISTINFKQQQYSLRSFSNSKSPGMCASLPDQFIQYHKADALRLQSSLKCDEVEVVPSLWQP